MKRIVLVGVLGLGVMVGLGACSTATGDATDDQDIAIEKNTENPAKVLPPDFDVRLTSLISPEDVGKAFGIDDAHVPYPDTYWPFHLVDDRTNKVIASNGIDDRWQGPSELSPLEKYMALADASKTAEAKAWENRNHGAAVPNVAGWFGHCPGWTAAAMVNPPLSKGVSAKRGSDGTIAACTAGEQGCLTFDIGDLNALEAETFSNGPGGFIGARCDIKPADIKRDKDGRVLQVGCRGLNSGSLLVVLANRMKNVKKVPNFVPKAIAIDAQNPLNTDQIWNQPAYRYEVNAAKAITEAEAIVATSKSPFAQGGALPTKYPHNAAAKGFFKVDIAIRWVQENGPNKRLVSGLLSTKIMRFAAVLELDGDPTSPATTIIGGEFLDDPSIGANRLTVPPFVWTADGVSADGTFGNNPFVRGSIVQQLVGLALK